MIKCMTLTKQQVSFCHSWIENGMKGKSSLARDYGVSVQTINNWLRKKHIQTYIGNCTRGAIQTKLDKFDVNTDRIVQELAFSAFLDPIDLFNDDGSVKPLNEMPESARRAIAGMDISELTNGEESIGVTKKIKINNKLNALETLAKYKKMLTDKPEAVDPNRPINIQIIYAN